MKTSQNASSQQEAQQTEQPSSNPTPITISFPSTPAEAAAPVAQEPPPKPQAPKSVVIPSVAVLTVHLQQAVGLKSNQLGDRFEPPAGLRKL